MIDFLLEILMVGDLFSWLSGNEEGGGLLTNPVSKVLTVLLVVLTVAAIVCLGLGEWKWGAVCAGLAVLTLVAVICVNKSAD